MREDVVSYEELPELMGMARYQRIHILMMMDMVPSSAWDFLSFHAEAKAIRKVIATADGRLMLQRMIDKYKRPVLKAGDVHEYDASDPHLITPRPAWRRVEIVWVGGDDVHYRRSKGRIIHQTSMSRFLEIVRPIMT